jgi:hypothetical protein
MRKATLLLLDFLLCNKAWNIFGEIRTAICVGKITVKNTESYLKNKIGYLRSPVDFKYEAGMMSLQGEYYNLNINKGEI